MSKSKKRMMLTPSYVRQFACTGPACEDTCCTGWNIFIDKGTYKKYKKLKDDELSPLIQKTVVRNKETTNDFDYAKIKLNEDKFCNMFQDGLCSIHKKLGEDYLASICLTYPRVTNEVNGIVEMALEVSCPVAARMALLNPEPMEFDQYEGDIHNSLLFKTYRNTANPKYKDKPEKFFWELRIFTIQLLQNRNYSLADRLVMLGMFSSQLQELVDNNQVDQIPSLIEKHMMYIHSGQAKEHLDNIPTRADVQVKLLHEITLSRFSQQITNERYFNCVKESLKGLKYVEGISEDEIHDNYVRAYEDHYLPFMSEHEYILENYLVNYAYKNFLPLGVKRTINETFVTMIVNYSMIKSILIGMAGYHKEAFNTEHVITCIQSYSRTIEHNVLFLRHIYDMLEKNNFNTTAYMAILVKN